MKKVVVLLLAMCMLMATLAGCGTEKDEDKKSNQTQAEQQESNSNDADEKDADESIADKNEADKNDDVKEVAVGTVLDAPEVAFDDNIEELYLYVTYPGDDEDEVLSMELAITQITDEKFVIYYTDGLLKNHELVYEATDTSVTKYYKDTFMEDFLKDTDVTEDEAEVELDNVLSLFSYFTVEHSDYSGLKYRKSDAIVASLTGDVYVYDVLENNEYAGRICVDKATGLMVSLKDADGNAIYTVQKIQTSNVEIPEYK